MCRSAARVAADLTASEPAKEEKLALLDGTDIHFPANSAATFALMPVRPCKPRESPSKYAAPPASRTVRWPALLPWLTVTCCSPVVVPTSATMLTSLVPARADSTK